MRLFAVFFIVATLVFVGPGQSLPLVPQEQDHEHDSYVPGHTHNVPFRHGNEVEEHDHDEGTPEDHDHPNWNKKDADELAEYAVCRVYQLRPGPITISYNAILGWVILDPEGCIYGTVQKIIDA